MCNSVELSCHIKRNRKKPGTEVSHYRWSYMATIVDKQPASSPDYRCKMVKEKKKRYGNSQNTTLMQHQITCRTVDKIHIILKKT